MIFNLFGNKVTPGELTPSNIPKAFLEPMAKQLETINHIDSALYEKYDVKRGLRNANGTGVVVGLTNIGVVKGYEIDEAKNKIPTEGKLFYRGYEIQDLVHNYIAEDRFGFEEITYLLIFGELPTTAQLESFKHYIGNKRELPHDFERNMIWSTPSKNVMNKIARSVLALYSYDENPEDTSIMNVLRQSIDLIGYFPALLAYAYQAKRSYFDNRTLHIRNPLPELSTAENILRMLRPDGKYTDLEAKCLDTCLILHAEHGGGNNSAFTIHLVSSSGTDTYSAISAAIGSLKGPKHGGANIKVIRMIQDLKENVSDTTDHKAVDEYLIKVLKKEANDRTGLIYGMGHAVYTVSDPRAKLLKGLAQKLAQNANHMEDYLLCEYIEERTCDLYEQVHGVKKAMCANVDLYSGLVYTLLNIPQDIATPLFALARLSGWAAHRIEELSTGNKLIRPAYIGVSKEKEFVPIAKRKPFDIEKYKKERE